MINLLKILGCRAGSPAGGIPASGYLLKADSGNVCIDCGPGTMSRLSEEEIGDLIGVVITHEHADHCLDLMPLAFYLLFPALKNKIPLYGPPSLMKVLKQYEEVFSIPSLPTLHAPISTAFELNPLPPGDAFSIGRYSFDTLLMKHPVETMAVRSRDYNFVYTSDGAFTEKLNTFCADSKILLAESTYLEEGRNDLEEHGHMTAEICASLAKSAGTQHLIMTHLADYRTGEAMINTARRFFHGSVTLAQPGLEIPFDME